MLNESLVRDEFSAVTSCYFNAAYMAPWPRRAQQKVQEAVARWADPSFLDYEWTGLPELLRNKLAPLLGVPAQNIIHQGSVSDIIGQIARGFPFREGDLVISLKEEYPSNILPWMVHERQQPYKLRLLERTLAYDPDRFVRSLPAGTRIVDLSHVSFQSGDRLDILEIGRRLKERGIFFVVDASQSLGGLRVSREEISVVDVLAAVTYKWLLGPYGHAFAYFSDSALAQVERSNGSWLSVQQSPHNLTRYTLETMHAAARFDRGQSPNVLLMHGLSGSLDLIAELGLAEIESDNQKLTRYFLHNTRAPLLTQTPLKANIVCLNVEDGTAIKKKLREKNIDTSLREGNLRLSFHLFNTREQVNGLLEALN